MFSIRTAGIVTIIMLAVAAALSPISAQAQFGTPLEFQNKPEEKESERTQRWRAGIEVAAATGPCAGIYGTFQVPVDWPEQDVKVVEEEISDAVRRSRYRELEGGVRQMVVLIPQLGFGETASAVVTFEITRRVKPLPSDTTAYEIPKALPPGFRRYLTNSPQIDCRSGKIRRLAKEITADESSAWEKAKAIHDWVKENIEHSNRSLQGTLETLASKSGNHEDLAGLFVALCRARKIPARLVWVPNYCYAEFYLANASGEEGDGEWFPCELKEKTDFGLVEQPYVILQKGENIRVPEADERQRFVPEFVNVKSGRRPRVSFIRETK